MLIDLRPCAVAETVLVFPLTSLALELVMPPSQWVIGNGTIVRMLDLYPPPISESVPPYGGGWPKIIWIWRRFALSLASHCTRRQRKETTSKRRQLKGKKRRALEPKWRRTRQGVTMFYLGRQSRQDVLTQVPWKGRPSKSMSFC